jgi:hypothetical protein
MITEIAQIEVKPGLEAEFEAAVKKATPIFKRSKGCHGMELRRSVEKPSRYRLLSAGRQWKTTLWVSGIRPSSKSGEVSSAIASPRRRKSSTCTRWCTGFDASARRCVMAGGKLAMTETGHDGDWA